MWLRYVCFIFQITGVGLIFKESNHKKREDLLKRIKAFPFYDLLLVYFTIVDAKLVDNRR